MGTEVNYRHATINEFCFVIDGASGLTDTGLFQDQSDARWFSHGLGEKLTTALSEKNDVRDILSKAVSELNHEYRNRLSRSDISSAGFDESSSPSASITIIRQCNNAMELYQLGDCPVIIKKMDNGLLVLNDERIKEMDNQAIQLLVNISKERNIPIKDGLV